ncbi:MAG: beta-ketoacyl synthase N-terminal-like domain-containing protein [Planctomycetota bacterium]
MSRDVLITGLGPVSALGLGKDDNWEALCAGRCGLAAITAFDASNMGAPIAGQVPDFKIRDFVPKSYRKATKVMARDIELAVAAADLAVRDAGLTTPGTDPDAERSYPAERTGCHIGAGLIAADTDELTAALAVSTDDAGAFDLKHWGAEGMQQLTPLWLLKYLPNMLACHVTIVHDAQGPSNTITCGEASGGLSVGESLRVIQRGHADVSLCGGAVSQLNPMAYYRQTLTGRLVGDAAVKNASGCVRPFDQNAAGGAVGEGGGIVVLEAADTFAQRAGDKHAYAGLLGFASRQTVHRANANATPDPEGRGIASAVRAALREAEAQPDDIDAIVPFGLGHPDWDGPEAAALHAVFGERLNHVPVVSLKSGVGNLHAGAGGYELAVAALMLHHQRIVPILNRGAPRPGFSCKKLDGKLERVLVVATSVGGQNTACVLGRAEQAS